jgi:hypothetical protein
MGKPDTTQSCVVSCRIVPQYTGKARLRPRPEIAWVMDAIVDGNFSKVERTNPFQARSIDPKLAWI